MTQMAETRDRATSDPAERGRVLERIKEEGVDFILLWFTDLEGHLKSFALHPLHHRPPRLRIRSRAVPALHLRHARLLKDKSPGSPSRRPRGIVAVVTGR